MSNCKNCIHECICNISCMNEPDGCGDFQDKSRILKMPCAIGDTVYVIANCDSIHIDIDKEAGFSECPFEYDCDFENCGDNNKRVFKTVVESIWIDKYTKKWFINCEKICTQIFLDDFNKTVFSTYEDAEKALKVQDE